MTRPRALARPLATLGALLALAACSVEIEGARCETPFVAGQCPSGQGCGNDRRCTERAAACAAPEAHCCPEDAEGCTASPRRCAGGTIQRCDGASDGADAVCGAWVAVETCGAGFECREPEGGAPACLCPPAQGPTVVADAAGGSAADAVPPPTGAVSGAAACRFRSLAVALETAAARAPGATVDAAGAFRTSLEGRPLAIPAGVTLRPLAGAAAAIEVDGPVTAALALGAGAAVEDLVVRSVPGSAAGDAIAADCADAAPVSLVRVRVEHAAGANRLGAGLRVAAPCLVTASDLTVDGATVGLAVSEEGTPAAHADVSLTGAALRACGRGAELGLGRVSFTSSTIEGNAGEGILASGTELTLAGTRIRRNGDGGLVVSSAQGLDVQDTIVCGNQAATPRGGTIARLAGGVVLGGNPPSSAPGFRGNRIFGNAGDQVLVHEAPDATWPLDGAASPTACAADANWFGGYPEEPLSARGLYGAAANVSARFNTWDDGDAPRPWTVLEGRDYEVTTGYSVEVGTGSGSFCSTLPDPLPTCD